MRGHGYRLRPHSLKSIMISDHIDHCYYINLAKREDRNAQMLSTTIPYLGLVDGQFSRYNAVDTSAQGTIALRSVGCAQSHVNIFRLAHDLKYKTILILEDDLVPSLAQSALNSHITHLFENYPDFNVCQLAYNDVQPVVPIDDSGIVLFSPHLQTASCYLIKTEFALSICEDIEEAINRLKNNENYNLNAFDQVWIQFQTLKNKWYALPRIGYQSQDFSNIEGRSVFYNYK